MAKKKKLSENQIAKNKRAFFDYHLEDTFEAGLELDGWEVKSLRAGKANIADAHVHIKNGEAWLFNANIQPLPTVSTHFTPDPTRSRKLLLHKSEIAQIFGAISKDGMTCVPLDLHWSKKNFVKCSVATAKGKKLHDKREASKERDWNRDKQRIMKAHNH
ncbi:MAG: SsrA-binding protein SmpB [Pseudomonadota bacterium]|nr:SsrA-binding protein SmpB [Pseudomonadota bacterium]